jgi:hypothetical protein
MAARADTTGAITGTVRDDGGKPVAGAAVVATSGAQVVSGLTDARGAFTFIDLTPGTFTIQLTKQGLGSRSYPGVDVVAGNERHLALAMPRLRWVTLCDCYHTFWQWGGPVTTRELYVVSKWTDPFFDSYDKPIDLSTVPGVQSSGGSVKF